MTDTEADGGLDLDQLRRSMKRTHTRLTRHHDRFTKMQAEDSPDTYDFHQLEEAHKAVEMLGKDYKKRSDRLCREEVEEVKMNEDDGAYDVFQEQLLATKFVIKLLLSKRSIHRASTSLETAVDVLKQAFLAEPKGDHKPAVTIIKEKIVKLLSELEKTNVMEKGPLISQTKAVQEKAGLTLAQVTKTSMADPRSTDTKFLIKDGSRSGFKPPTITVPTFSGALEDWQSFWSAFERAIHQTDDFSKAAKLHYLREAMKDKTLYRRLSA